MYGSGLSFLCIYFIQFLPNSYIYAAILIFFFPIQSIFLIVFHTIKFLLVSYNSPYNSSAGAMIFLQAISVLQHLYGNNI